MGVAERRPFFRNDGHNRVEATALARREQVRYNANGPLPGRLSSRSADPSGDTEDRLKGAPPPLPRPALCSAIHERSVVFPVAFDISEDNSRRLGACARTPNPSYNVTSGQITYGSSSSAGTINQLRLVK